jgi:hypothetical protein
VASNSDWTEVFASWHDMVIQQGPNVDRALAECRSQEPKTLLLTAVEELAKEVKLHRAAINAVRMGIARGHLVGAEN